MIKTVIKMITQNNLSITKALKLSKIESLWFFHLFVKCHDVQKLNLSKVQQIVESENLKQNKNKLNKIALGDDKEDKEEKSFSKQKVEIIHH